MNIPINVIEIEFSKLEYGTTFTNIYGFKWVKVSDRYAVPEQAFSVGWLEFEAEDLFAFLPHEKVIV